MKIPMIKMTYLFLPRFDKRCTPTFGLEGRRSRAFENFKVGGGGGGHCIAQLILIAQSLSEHWLRWEGGGGVNGACLPCDFTQKIFSFV